LRPVAEINKSQKRQTDFLGTWRIVEGPGKRRRLTTTTTTPKGRRRIRLRINILRIIGRDGDGLATILRGRLTGTMTDRTLSSVTNDITRSRIPFGDAPVRERQESNREPIRSLSLLLLGLGRERITKGEGEAIEQSREVSASLFRRA
jgi:hypothetical protein